MTPLEKGITQAGTGYGGKSWNILGQLYFPKAITDSTFAIETNSDPGQFEPVHVHPTQDEFILVQEVVLSLKLDGDWVEENGVRRPLGRLELYARRQRPGWISWGNQVGFLDPEPGRKDFLRSGDSRLDRGNQSPIGA
jgi:hypothetical protein